MISHILQLWTVIEQVLETDFLVSATDEEKLPGNIKKVGQKVFLERRPDRDIQARRLRLINSFLLFKFWILNSWWSRPTNFLLILWIYWNYWHILSKWYWELREMFSFPRFHSSTMARFHWRWRQSLSTVIWMTIYSRSWKNCSKKQGRNVSRAKTVWTRQHQVGGLGDFSCESNSRTSRPWSVTDICNIW